MENDNYEIQCNLDGVVKKESQVLSWDQVSFTSYESDYFDDQRILSVKINVVAGEAVTVDVKHYGEDSEIIETQLYLKDLSIDFRAVAAPQETETPLDNCIMKKDS